jgi:SAM-dependent methyltransferase
MEKKYSDVEIKTKKVYLEQHKNFLKDETIFNRHLAAAQDLLTYDLPASFFEGKSVLDAGCGNTGYFQVAMFNLGVRHVTCLDIGDQWQQELVKALQHRNIPKEFYDFASGSTLDLPFANESFDFVASNGVLMHLETVEMASQAITELTRVTKHGGVLYSHIGIDKPGIVDRYIVKALRTAYLEDEEFKNFINNLNPDSLNSELSSIYKECSMHDPRLLDFLSSLSHGLITLDSTTFWQNMLQVPVQQGPLLSEDWGRSVMENNGLINIRRPKGTYWIRNDFRKFLAPIHFSLGSNTAKIFYGNGHVKLVAEKPYPIQKVGA